MLPHPRLKPLYEQWVWVWVFRDFKNGPGDLAAERVLNRFGVTSWPQNFLADPVSGKVLADTGRSVDSFLEAAGRVGGIRKPPGDPRELQGRLDRARDLLRRGKRDEARKLLGALAGREDPWEFWLEARERLEALASGAGKAFTAKDLSDPDADRRADALDFLAERLPDTAFSKEALPLLEDPDGDVRLRALRYVRKGAPRELSGRLPGLFADPLDPVKWLAFEAAGESRDPGMPAALHEALRRLDAREIESRNPNMFRFHVIGALGGVGDLASVGILAPLASNGDFKNSLTFTAAQALGRIGSRLGSSLVTEALISGFPQAPLEDPRHLYYVRKFHDALETATGNRTIAFPAAWGPKEREALLEAWRRACPRPGSAPPMGRTR